MNKFILTLLLAIVAFFGNAQRPDSVYLNNEWRYIYPATEPIDFESSYYNNFGLDMDQYLVWVEWKMNNDPRANLAIEHLLDSIQFEKYRRLEVTDSLLTDYEISNSVKMGRRNLRHTRSQKYQREYPETNYELNLKNILNVPPVVQDLPNGKYVQYFMPFASVDSRVGATIDSTLVSCLFELKDNELENKFLRLDPQGDTLALGQFSNGFKDGHWRIVTYKTVYVPYNTFFHPTPKPSSREDYTEGDFNYGVKNGQSITVEGNKLTSIRQYEDGKLEGLTVLLGWKDSTVYDATSVFEKDHYLLGVAIDEVVDGKYLSYHLSGSRESFKESLEAERYQNDLLQDLSLNFGSNGMSYASKADSMFLDSIINKTKFGYSSKKYPRFKSFYRVYDRDTKQLIFERQIDQKNNTFYGTTHFIDGSILDTIWMDPKSKNTRTIVRNKRGKIVHSYTYDEEKKKPTTLEIDGFQAVQQGVGKDRYYSYSNMEVRNDTVFRSIRWNQDKLMVSCRYDILSSQTQDVILKSAFGDRYEQRSNKEQLIESYTKQDFQFIRYHDYETGKDSSSITVNGKPYTGLIKFKRVNKNPKLKMSKSKLVIHSTSSDYLDYWEDKEILKFRVNSRIVKDVLEDQLGFQRLNIYKVKGRHNHDGFNGEVKMKCTNVKNLKLNYVAGEPNGRVEIYEDEYVYPHAERDYSEHNRILGANTFSHSVIGAPFVRTSYQLVNGEIDGPMIFYTSRGDTTAYLPFKDGLYEGKFFQYTESNRITGEFKDNKFIGDLKIEEAVNGKYITVLESTFDSNGNFVSAMQHCVVNDDHVELKEEIKVTGLPNSKFLVHAELNGEPLASWIVDRMFCLENKYYNGKFLSYSLRYDSIQMEHRLPVIAFLNNYYIGSEGLSFTGGPYGGTGNIDAFLYTSDPDLDKSDYNHFTYFTKYYPNDTIAREGYFVRNQNTYSKKKFGVWKAYSYNGKPLHTTFYNRKDSICQYAGENWKVIGFQTEFDSLGNKVSERWLIEELEKYECSSDEYYAERQYITISSSKPEQLNGWCKNYYDNGSIMNEGNVVNGVPDGLWKFYAPDGKLNRLGRYSNGKTDGKWLYGDLSEKAYIGEMCIDPDSENYAVIIHNLEKDKEVEVRVYKKGELLSSSSYGNENNYYRGERSNIELR